MSGILIYLGAEQNCPVAKCDYQYAWQLLLSTSQPLLSNHDPVDVNEINILNKYQYYWLGSLNNISDLWKRRSVLIKHSQKITDKIVTVLFLK